MAILKAEDISEEQREEAIGSAITGEIPKIPGIEIVRGISPLAVIALKKANNPYITSRKGFEAMGFKFDEGGKPIGDESDFGTAMMPKTAEMLVVFSCTREKLKQFAKDSGALEDAAFEMLDTLTTKNLEDATVVISEQIKLLSTSQAMQDPEKEKPSASTLDSGKKKPSHTG